MTAVCFP